MTHGHDADSTHAHPTRLMLDRGLGALSIPQVLHSQRLAIFYGDMHNHTGFSDGMGHPEEALAQMRARGLHFAAITDHGEFYDRMTAQHNARNWDELAELTEAMTTADFLAIRGFEWSSPHQGHSNVWWSEEWNGYLRTGDETMHEYYRWLATAGPTQDAAVLAGFNHPGRELACFDGCTYTPTLDDRIVTLECFNRDDDYGDVYFRALDRGWHVGAIGVSDHHGDDWGSPKLPRAGMLAPALTMQAIQETLQQRRVFATRSPTLALLITGNGSLMGSQLRLGPNEPLELGVWCDDREANGSWTRFEVWSNGASLIDSWEHRGLHLTGRRVAIGARTGGEQWFVVRVLRDGAPLAYSSPIWARWH
jgi:hypothetical protein